MESKEILKVKDIPENLQKIKQPPMELYYQGDVELLYKPAISIVGTRKPTPYTKSLIYELSSRLSKVGFSVVSGGALGSDIEAHRGAFPNTIVIQANSLDYIYPKSNQKDLERVRDGGGLLISENYRGVAPHTKRFVHRNRLVVGLSDSLIVAQADERSGTLQSINIALREGKTVYTFPQRLQDSRATNRLLSEGKIELIYDLDQFIERQSERYKFELQRKEGESDDPFLRFCQTNPTYNELFQKFPDQIFEYEFNGKIEVRNGTVYLV
jgi:DNA processing protein